MGADTGQQARDLLLRRDGGAWIVEIRFGVSPREAKR
jgi:hypothetical protein